MGKTNNVFISWSGRRSQWIAEALRNWLPMILQGAKPWMSRTDIEKGSRGLPEVSAALEGMKVGIICLTPENLNEPWILYESGALSKIVDDKTRLCTYLLAGLQFQDVKPPLGMFQATKADKEETRSLVHTINKAVNEEPMVDSTLDALFERCWPDLEEKLTQLPGPERVVEATRSVDDMVAEILEITRAEANRKKKIDFFDQYIPIFEEFLPLLSEALKNAKSAQLTSGSDKYTMTPPPTPSVPPEPNR